MRAGADGVIAKGCEAGGSVGPTTTFILLQRVLADPAVDAPVWAWGGIGPHTAAAAVAGGAAGVVLDTQLALTAEAGLPEPVAAAIRAMDGSETTVVAGHRVFVRPDLPTDELATRLPDCLGARDLRTHLLPVGQDGAFAAGLADRHRGTGGVIRAVRAAISAQLSTADRRGPDTVAQGPMTRVSDQPAFAAAVADEGGLPFLALALSTGEQTRRLLTETADLLGDRPWGAGILGFVPPELRAAQLAALTAVRPPYALIAGGRPAQAAPLEAAGVRTHLHVPSPGLLDRFLREGARRFVFEGRECGGHAGPRGSFSLWEAQISRLLAYLDQTGADPATVHVLFAGGVHDARSAAMVVAAAAPLAARGSAVGVLMGTAYLFTEEAVAAAPSSPSSSGWHWTVPAPSCWRPRRGTPPAAPTVRMSTPSPAAGSACWRTRYPRRTGGPSWSGSTWADSRAASKGLRRTPDGLERVGPDEQHREGMFMIGDVATLRAGTTTIAALHADVTTGAQRMLAARAAELARPARPEPSADPLDIAIVGMACVYPESKDLAAYWRTVVTGVDAVGDVPPDRWDTSLYHDPDPALAGRRTPSTCGGFLPATPFDALAYGIPPTSLGSIEAVQLLALEVATRALADAGYADREFDRERCSVIFGAEAGSDLANTYGFRSLYPGYHGELPGELDAHLPELTEDSFPGVLANVIAGRIANRLDLGGVNYTVDAACAASLAAVDLAAKELCTGGSDLVLCGGADVHNGINDYLMFSSVRALSPTGRCRTFDATADGIALGEGVACVVLKRLADAERDGDRIYAVLKAVAGSSDGRSLGLTAPRPEGQRRALTRAYARAGIEPGEVGLVEAHGTGTVVGDRTELATLTELFAGTAPAACALGSVKSQIGHTKCAAGLAGLIKAARSVHTGIRPPTLHLREPNPFWEADTSPFFFDTEARPWVAPPERRVAGVSAFGFGGTNFHAVLAGYPGAPEPAHGLDEWPAELFLFRGVDAAHARQAMDRLAERIAANDAAGRPWPLRDLAAGCCADSEGPVLAAFVAHDLDDLAARLERARAGAGGAGIHHRRDPAAEVSKVAFLFPGQGSQRPGMLTDLFVAFPRLRRVLHQADAGTVSAMFPPAAFTARDRARQRAAVTDTRVAQPALGIAGAAVHDLLRTLGVRPDLAAGHSYGELTALWSAGVFDTGTLLELSTARAAAILAAAGGDPGTMAAVKADADTVAGVLTDPSVVIANHNAPGQCVISGPTVAVGAAVDALRAAGHAAEGIPVACAFHSPVVADVAAVLAERLAGTEPAAPAFGVWSTVTAAAYPDDPAAVRPGGVARRRHAAVRAARQPARRCVGRARGRFRQAAEADRERADSCRRPVTGRCHPWPPPPRLSRSLSARAVATS
ncbi:Acyl transferase domain-containing protein [Amycolatopsis arida]|uniref:Acyl transferase domain-containing protein n=1 Tax=Amycolatopsis arida TaxID=587909 RepID=A0A1I6AMA7_9PSEU|nr:acyl transferase domain-containing protein [Amycolatopsis arida]SFQ69834.1 Acyl transferase domain-containing protein [Amycolatopsis arida]